eukprot:CAMPEP_0119306318 /NCGR_PEP_ID=MMETSP1333-20130426/7103_1 /TAXON_ID=418940 /ORGANISM="Scyphosphaera apsteinii, Strain RCC1455" /LENGTH=148 /DNA_ID=CAMNT_0007309585 /DNA_START=106 /DNA_END=549 /DNA_ORIENTATION=-
MLETCRLQARRGHETTARQAAIDAATALRIAQELEEDGDAFAARRCVQHAVDRAYLSVSLTNGRLCYDETYCPVLASSEPPVKPRSNFEPPAALIASIALCTLGSLAHDSDDLDAGREAFQASLKIWPGNVTAQFKLAELELHHGCFE